MTDSDSDSGSLHSLSVDIILWCNLIRDMKCPPEISHQVWYYWRSGRNAPSLNRLSQYLRYLSIPEAVALKHLGWGDLPGVGSIGQLQKWVRSAKMDRALAKRVVKETIRVANGEKPRKTTADYVATHKGRLDYIKYLKSVGLPYPVDADGKPLKLKDIKLPTGFVRTGPRMRPEERPETDYSHLEGAPHEST